MTYQEKLLDPKWQRKRLEVYNRDNFTCKSCGDTKTTLHVHHKKYTAEIWDEPLENLETLCAHCHYIKERFKKETPEFDLLSIYKKYSKKYDSYYLTAVAFSNERNGYLVFQFSKNNNEDIQLVSCFVVDETAHILSSISNHQKKVNG